MTLNKLAKIMLFFNSYSFFFILIILKTWANKGMELLIKIIFSLLFIFIIIISLIFTLIIVIQAKANVDTYLKIKKIEDSQVNILGYIFSYIVPFIDLDLSNIYELLIMAILIYIIGYYYIKSNLFHLNPTLNMCSFKISRIVTEDDKTIIIIYKNNEINKNSKLKTKIISKNIHVGVIDSGD